MAWPNGQTRRVELVVQNAQVSGSGTHSAFPVLITRANLPDEMCSPTDSNRAQSDGGDIRAAAANDGTGQIPIEIVNWEYDSSDGAGDAVIEIWVKRDLNTASDTSIWLAYNTAGTTSADAVTDTYGRNAVWSDYEMVTHLNSTSPVDSTGNHTLTVNSAPALVTDGPSGLQGLDFDGTDDSIDCGYGTQGTQRTLQAIAKMDNAVSAARTSWIVGTPRFHITWDHAAGSAWQRKALTFTDAWYNDDFGALTQGNIYHLSAVLNTSSIEAYTDGASGGSSSRGTGTPANTGNLFIGRHSSDDCLAGNIYEVRDRFSVLSADWLATEYANQNSPSTFIIEGTPEAVGGGGSTTPEAVTASLVLAAAVGMVVTYERAVTAAAVFTPVVTAANLFTRTVAASATYVAATASEAVVGISVAAGATYNAAVSTSTTFVHNVAAAAIFTAAKAKTVGVGIAASVAFAVARSWTIGKNIAVGATYTAASTEANVAEQGVAASAVFTATSSEEYTAAADVEKTPWQKLSIGLSRWLRL